MHKWEETSTALQGRVSFQRVALLRDLKSWKHVTGKKTSSQMKFEHISLGIKPGML